MENNVHKIEFKKVTLPEIFQEEDRGLNRCATPTLVLADATSTHRYKNDLTGISLICDSLTVLLEKSNGDVIPALGIAVNFPFQPNAKGFVIDWRQHLDYIDCYKVKVVFDISGIIGEYYYGAFDLKPWSFELAKGTVQVFSVLDDFVRTTGINYGDSGFCDTIRFKGTFGEMQPNYTTENIIYHDRERKKVRREALRTYYLNTSFLVNCFTSKIDENHLLAASQIYITEHNPFNHEQYREFPVILSEEESPTFEYPKGGYASVHAVFLDKKAIYESKYFGKTSGTANVSLELPQGIDCDNGGGGSCLDATVNIVDSNSTLIGSVTVPSGGSDTFVVNDLPCSADSKEWILQFIDQTDIIQVVADANNIATFASGIGANIGTMEVSTDGIAYSPLTFPFTPSAGTYYFKRGTNLITATYIISE